MRAVRARGYLVKLDTNGSFPDRLRALVDEGLADYVAMDLKNSRERYGDTQVDVVVFLDCIFSPSRVHERMLPDGADDGVQDDVVE